MNIEPIGPVLGAEVSRVSLNAPSASEIAALREALALNETTLIDVDTDPEAYPPITLFDDKLEDIRAKRAKEKLSRAA